MNHPPLKDAQGKAIDTGPRMGIYGGTFDPVHIGHMTAALTVTKAFSLTSLLFIPAMHPPHKQKTAVTPFEHRIAMLKIAAAGERSFFISSMEAERGGPSYTVDTLTMLRGQVGGTVDLFFIIGLDTFIEINTWKEYRRIPELAGLIVIDRPIGGPQVLHEIISSYFPGYIFKHGINAWTPKGNRGRIYSLAMEPVAISSSRIREMYRAGESVRHLVPTGVEEYMNRFSQFYL